MTSGCGHGLRAARVENAFLREVFGREERLTDLETAWDLASVRGYLDTVMVNDKGEVQGMTEEINVRWVSVTDGTRLVISPTIRHHSSDAVPCRCSYAV